MTQKSDIEIAQSTTMVPISSVAREMGLDEELLEPYGKYIAKVSPDAIDEEPLDSMTSETTRIVYGNSSSEGITGRRARSARLPWPISRRFGLPMRPVSPVQNGGKL